MDSETLFIFVQISYIYYITLEILWLDNTKKRKILWQWWMILSLSKYINFTYKFMSPYFIIFFLSSNYVIWDVDIDINTIWLSLLISYCEDKVLWMSMWCIIWYLNWELTQYFWLSGVFSTTSYYLTRSLSFLALLPCEIFQWNSITFIAFTGLNQGIKINSSNLTYSLNILLKGLGDQNIGQVKAEE